MYNPYRSTSSEITYANFKLLKHRVQKELYLAYRSYLNNLFIPESHPQSNQKIFWSYIKALRKENKNVPVLIRDGISYETCLDKAKILYEQFQSVFTTEPNSSLPSKGPSPHPTMSAIYISWEGIYNLLLNINTHKACGPD